VKGEGCGGWTVDKAGSPGESCLVLRHVEDGLHCRLLPLCVHHRQAEPVQFIKGHLIETDNHSFSKNYLHESL
jgi:hypothetical protein